MNDNVYEILKGINETNKAIESGKENELTVEENPRELYANMHAECLNENGETNAEEMFGDAAFGYTITD